MNRAPWSDSAEAPRGQDRYRALAPLLEAHQIATDLNRPVWDLALQAATLQGLGVSDSVLRWLICQGLIEHRFEIVAARQTARVFQEAAGTLRLAADSCFVLTEAGLTLARRLARGGDTRVDEPHQPVIPHYDTSERILYFAGQIVKHFRVPAPNQELILLGFEEEHWPKRLSDPLPGRPAVDAKRRLSDAIRHLNKSQQGGRVRFRGDGTGSGVVWEEVAANRPEIRG